MGIQLQANTPKMFHRPMQTVPYSPNPIPPLGMNPVALLCYWQHEIIELLE